MESFTNLNFDTLWPHLIPNPNVTIRMCPPDWLPGSHQSLQLANLLTMIGLLIAISSLPRLLFLRGMLILSNVLMIAWSSFVVCQMDVLAWNILFLVVNFVHLLILIYKLHPFIRFELCFGFTICFCLVF